MPVSPCRHAPNERAGGQVDGVRERAITAAGGQAAARADGMVKAAEATKAGVDNGEIRYSAAVVAGKESRCSRKVGWRLLWHLFSLRMRRHTWGPDLFGAGLAQVAEQLGVDQKSLQLGMFALSTTMQYKAARWSEIGCNSQRFAGCKWEPASDRFLRGRKRESRIFQQVAGAASYKGRRIPGCRQGEGSS